MSRIPRIPKPIIEQLPPPVIDRVPAPVVEFMPPPILQPRPPTIDVPSFEPPSFEPPDVPDKPDKPAPRPPQQQEESEEEEDTYRPGLDVPNIPQIPVERPEVQIPFTETYVPLPYPREVALAGTTAVAATAAALAGKAMVETLLKVLKPVVRRIMLRLKERSNKQFTDYELQQFFAFEKRTPEQKQVMKRLQKELEEEKEAQLEEYLQSRQSRQKHKGSTDEIEHQPDELHHNEVIERVQNQVEP